MGLYSFWGGSQVFVPLGRASKALSEVDWAIHFVDDDDDEVGRFVVVIVPCLVVPLWAPC